ncbi:hypothetical protein ABZP36_014356 [Zizania latifolia]
MVTSSGHRRGGDGGGLMVPLLALDANAIVLLLIEQSNGGCHVLAPPMLSLHSFLLYDSAHGGEGDGGGGVPGGNMAGDDRKRVVQYGRKGRGHEKNVRVDLKVPIKKRMMWRLKFAEGRDEAWLRMKNGHVDR